MLLLVLIILLLDLLLIGLCKVFYSDSYAVNPDTIYAMFLN